jgi:hypothetical protein
MSRKFECHITMPREQSTVVQVVANQELLGFAFSAIDGDPVMGKQAYCYLTCYDTDGLGLLEKMRVASGVLKRHGVLVLREKVEEIVYDTKTGHDVLTAVPA